MVMGGCGNASICGGDSGGANTVSGVAASGSPLIGTVSLKDSSTPAKVSPPVTIGDNGAFVINVDGMQPPFILKAVGTANGTNYILYSFSPALGIANINPIGNLAVANAAGVADLAALYAAPSGTTMQTIASNLAKAVTDIQTKLQPLFAAYNVTANPVSGSYTANHLGLDGLLDVVKVTISGTGTVTFTNKLTNSVISSGLISAITSWPLPQNIPLPPIVVNVTPETAMVNILGNATFSALVSNSTSTQVTWSVVEAGGGTITSSILTLLVFFMWIRGTLPRLRIDQLTRFAWKFLVPLALVNLGTAAFWHLTAGWDGLPLQLLRWALALAFVLGPFFLMGRRLSAGVAPRTYRYAT